MKLHRVYLKHDEFRFMSMFLQRREIYYIAGNHSMFVPSRQEKYIMTHRPDGYKIIRDWPDLDNQIVSMTPGEAARTELLRTFPGLRRVGWQSSHVRLFDWRWPMMFSGPYKGEGVYIDLKSAYWQLYRRLWLDTCFPGGYGCLSLTGIADKLQEWKAARNSIIGICAARTAKGVKGYKTIFLQTQNPFLSPGLWATVQATLNEIAWEAERRGAFYIATDGFFFKSLIDAAHFEEFLYDNDLNYRMESGEIEIKAWGVYKTRSKKTKAFDKVNPNATRPFRAIRILDTEFPNRVLRWWSKSIPTYSRSRWQIGGIKEWQMV